MTVQIHHWVSGQKKKGKLSTLTHWRWKGSKSGVKLICQATKGDAIAIQFRHMPTSSVSFFVDQLNKLRTFFAMRLIRDLWSHRKCNASNEYSLPIEQENKSVMVQAKHFYLSLSCEENKIGDQFIWQSSKRLHPNDWRNMAILKFISHRMQWSSLFNAHWNHKIVLVDVNVMEA